MGRVGAGRGGVEQGCEKVGRGAGRGGVGGWLVGAGFASVRKNLAMPVASPKYPWPLSVPQNKGATCAPAAGG